MIIKGFIFDLFMCGKTSSGIATLLTNEGVPTPAGKGVWQASTILSMLQNEKYRGSALLQKHFTVDFLTKKMKVNEGEVPQYYIENSHEAIINPAEFEWVQAEIARRKKLGKAYSGKSVFSTKLICADCGELFGSKVWQSNTKYRKTIWQCNGKFKSDEKCTTPHISEEEIKARFIQAYNRLTYDRESLLEDCTLILDAVSDCTEIDEKLKTLYEEVDVVVELTRRCVEENCQEALNQEEYLKRYNSLVERYDGLKKRIATLATQKQEKQFKGSYISGLMFEITEYETAITEFDEQMWMLAIDSVLIHHDGRMVFRFRNGAEIEA